MRDEATAVDIGERRRLTPWHHLARLTGRAEVMGSAGAIIGVVGRFEASNLARRYLPAPFPIGTLLINLAGCLLIGTVQTLFLGLGAIRRPTQLFLSAGLCGGFTTVSTFSVETVQLIQAGKGHAGPAISGALAHRRSADGDVRYRAGARRPPLA